MGETLVVRQGLDLQPGQKWVRLQLQIQEWTLNHEKKRVRLHVMGEIVTIAKRVGPTLANRGCTCN